MSWVKKLFLMIEVILYAMILWSDLFHGEIVFSVIFIKYFSIVLCFLYSVVSTYFSKKKNLLFPTILLLIVIADYQLLIRDAYFKGVVYFLIVQLLFVILIVQKFQCSGWRTIFYYYLIDSLSSILIIWGLQHLGIVIDWIAVAAIPYAVCFIINIISVISAIKRIRPTGGILFLSGFLLYFLCDLNVAIFHLSEYLTMDPVFYAVLYQAASACMWMFYVPGILLITLLECGENGENGVGIL